MTKEFVTYEQALALKELGFDEPCFGYWKSKNWLIQEKTRTDGYTHADQECSAPLYQQAFRWFRDVHELEGVVQQANDYTWYKFSIYQKSNFYTSEGWKVLKSQGLEYKTYEEAESVCLDELIEIVKTK